MQRMKTIMDLRMKKGKVEENIIKSTTKEDKFKMNPLIRLSRRERDPELYLIGDLVFIDEDGRIVSSMRRKNRSRTKDRRRRF